MAVFPPNDSRNDLYPYMRDYTAFLKKMERPLVGRQKEMAQLMAAMSRPELCNAILLAEAGSGKACDVETPLPVADGRGYIRLGDVRPGDYVFDESGRPVKVLRVFPQGCIPAYRVGFMDGSEIVCNDEHLWAVRSMEDAMAGTPYRTVSLADIMREGVDRGPASSHMVPLAGAVEREPVQLPMDPYDMGMALGQDVVSLYRDAVLDGHVLRGSVEQRRRFLHGLMDRAGAVNAVHYMGAMFPGVRIDVPVGVSRAVRTLCASLGYRSHAKSMGGDVVRIELLVSWEEARGLFTREVEGLSDRWETGLPACGGVAIRSVEPLGEDREMLCIYVDGPSHLFQIGYDHIVTHNTALVQGTMVKDTARAYLEVDLPKMISNLKNENEMADKLKQLFREVEAFRKAENKEIVLFIDEFHQIVQLSPAAVEVLKPLLADSGTRGIRVIAATTYIEFQEYIASNLPLVERLQRINLNAPDENTVVSILRGMAERYGVKSQFPNDSMFHSIYEYTNRYIPSTAQPRKSILMLDSMIGWHRFTKKPMDMKMLADVIYDTEGVNIAFRVNAGEIKKELDKVVLSQDFATSAIEGRLQICVADLNNKNRPMSSFLFTGSTGTGKGIYDEEMIPVWTSDGSVVKKRNGDLAVGDYVFNRKGEPVLVTGVYHRGLKDVYRVTLGDGRKVIVDGSHLWSWKYAKGHDSERYVTSSTEDILAQGLYRSERNGRRSARFWIPMNGPMQYSERGFPCHPYVLGALIGNGCLTIPHALTLSSGNRFVPEKIAGLLGAAGTKQQGKNYNWVFVKEYGSPKSRDSLVQRDDVLAGVPGLVDCKSYEKFIPEEYKYGSIEQRWELIQGLFDTDGSIGQFDGDRFNVSYSTTSETLARDIQEVLFSLGIASSIANHGDRGREGDVHDEYHLHVKALNEVKAKFFTLPKKHDLAMKARGVAKYREKLFDCVAIESIEKLDGQLPTTCIMVEDEEHLYQGPSGVVSHNTETTKQLCRILFQDDRALVRMDMTEYALPESLERFRQELTTAVWTRPYCILLLDEIEKACAPVTRILLQVLDDGRLLDRHNREVTFKNAYIIITTNAGSEIYKTIAQYGVDDTGSGKLMEKYESLIRDSIKGTTGGGKFPPELLGRIDCLVPFQPLSEKTMANICEMKLKKLAKEVYDKHHITVQFDQKIIRYIVQDKMTTDSDAGGARGVVSRIEREVTIAVSRFINEHQDFRSGRTIFVCVEGNLAVDNKFQLETDGRVVVRDTPPEGGKGALI